MPKLLGRKLKIQCTVTCSITQAEKDVIDITQCKRSTQDTATCRFRIRVPSDAQSTHVLTCLGVCFFAGNVLENHIFRKWFTRREVDMTRISAVAPTIVAWTFLAM
jgi:hypothetical protein